MLRSVARSRIYPDEAPDLSSSTAPITCPTHGTPLVCPTCIGAAGGKRKSKAKAIAAQRNAKRPRPGARGKPKPRRAADKA